MAEHQQKGQKKQEEVDQKQRSRQKQPEPLFDQLHAWDQNAFPGTETPFQPRMEAHAELLAKARTDAQRASLVMRLQRTYGNRYVQRLLNSRVVQAKLTVSHPEDACEKEADRVADMVTHKISAFEVQRQTPEEEEEIQTNAFEVQRQEEEEEEVPIQAQASDGGQSVVSGEVETRINNAQGGGQPLPDVVREPMEKAIGADFSGVRVHADAEANMLNQHLGARAFTTGQDIFFGEGEYRPGSSSGHRLIAHELAHVVQQTGRHKPQRQASKKKTGQPHWGSKKLVRSNNPFASRALREILQTAPGGAVPDIQRYKTKVGVVNFESSNFTATIPAALQKTLDGGGLTLGSGAYNPSGKVTATSWAFQNVGQWQVGFLQTVYKGERIGYYDAKPALKAGQKYKRTVTLGNVAVRDGTAGSPPWYGAPGEAANPIETFDAAKKSTKEVKMWDAPQSGFPWSVVQGGKTQYLTSTGGYDHFYSWLAVYNPANKHEACLNHAEWKVNYGTSVTVDAKNPAGSTVTITTGGAQVVGTGDGNGGKNPLMTDPVANDVADVVDGTW